VTLNPVQRSSDIDSMKISSYTVKDSHRNFPLRLNEIQLVVSMGGVQKGFFGMYTKLRFT